MAILKISIELLFFVITPSVMEEGDINIPHLNGPCYIKPGDIKLGVIIAYSARGKENYCSSSLDHMWGPQYAEAFRYAIKKINKRQDILPNTTLGYILTDACDRDLVALARSMSFIPTRNIQNIPDYSLNSLEGFTKNCSDKVTFYDVAGIVGPENSRYALMVAGLMTLFEVPILGTFTTSDELTDNSRFEYFMR